MCWSPPSNWDDPNPFDAKTPLIEREMQRAPIERVRSSVFRRAILSDGRTRKARARSLSQTNEKSAFEPSEHEQHAELQEWGVLPSAAVGSTVGQQIRLVDKAKIDPRQCGRYCVVPNSECGLNCDFETSAAACPLRETAFLAIFLPNGWSPSYSFIFDTAQREVRAPTNVAIML
jgi:hypothetical protein